MNITNPASVCTGGPCQIWAPEWFIDSDASVHIVVAVNLASSGSAFQIFELHPTAADMSTWSAPLLLTVTGQANIIDPFLMKIGSTYYLWFKKSDNLGYITYATASSMFGPYTTVSTYSAWGYGEGPSVLSLGGNSWRVYFDACLGGTCSLAGGQLYYAVSTDNFATFSTPVPLPTGQQFKQGTPHTYP